jgi:hypothetical protein
MPKYRCGTFENSIGCCRFWADDGLTGSWRQKNGNFRIADQPNTIAALIALNVLRCTATCLQEGEPAPSLLLATGKLVSQACAKPPACRTSPLCSIPWANFTGLLHGTLHAKFAASLVLPVPL